MCYTIFKVVEFDHFKNMAGLLSFVYWTETDERSCTLLLGAAPFCLWVDKTTYVFIRLNFINNNKVQIIDIMIS